MNFPQMWGWGGGFGRELVSKLAVSQCSLMVIDLHPGRSSDSGPAEVGVLLFSFNRGRRR